MKLKIELILFIGIILIAFFLRFYKLGTVPNGLYQDETAIGYNAYSILTTGRDEYGKKFPLYFKSFGDQKLPVYVYATVIPIKLFGLTDASPRVPSAFFGVLSVGMLYLLVRKISNDKNLALLSSFLLAINPWHLHYSRATFEVSIALFFFLLGYYLLISAVKKKSYLLVLSVVCFVVALYTYNLTRLLAPALFAVLVVIHKKNIQEIPKKIIAISILVGAILLIPFVMTIFDAQGAASAKGTLITSSGVIQAQLLEQRSYVTLLPDILEKTIFNKYVLTLNEYVRHLISYLSIDFLFLHGSSHGNHGIGVMGQFYLFEIISMVVGLALAVKKKTIWLKPLLLWAVVAVAVASLTREAPHATRSFFVLPFFVVLSSFGIMEIWKHLYRKKSMFYTFLLGGLIMFGVYCISYYFISYYYRFPISYAKEWRSEDKELVELINSSINDVDKVVIDDESGFIYTSYLYYSAFPPKQFYSSVNRGPSDAEGFSKVHSFGKIEFREIHWDTDIKTPSTILISSLAKKPANVAEYQSIQYPVRPVVLSTREQIMSFPVQDTAYVLVKTK